MMLTPTGLAVFTDRRGNYRFVDSGQIFGVEIVVNPDMDDGWTDELSSLAYASQ